MDLKWYISRLEIKQKKQPYVRPDTDWSYIILRLFFLPKKSVFVQALTWTTKIHSYILNPSIHFWITSNCFRRHIRVYKICQCVKLKQKIYFLLVEVLIHKTIFQILCNWSTEGASLIFFKIYKFKNDVKIIVRAILSEIMTILCYTGFKYN